jgi:lysophospholipase L1-like esterase
VWLTGALTALSLVTWAASPQQLGPAAADQTYRLVVHTSAAGGNLRIRLSNAFGDRPVVFGRAYVGARRGGASVTDNRPLSFGGGRSVDVPAGGTVYSDPLPGRVPAGAELVISLYVRTAAGPATGHGMAMQTSYQAAGDHAADRGGTAFTQKIGSWFYLDALVVDGAGGTVAAFGDSITDGWQSSSDQNDRWPDYLARRLRDVGIANEGISGNKVLVDGAGQSALNRLDRDVLALPGLRTVLMLEGVNDLKAGAAAADLIAGYRQVIAQAHAVGVCVVGATVLPFQGWGEWTPAAEAIRQQVNTFIRSGGAFDAAIDLDREMRSPYDPTRLFPPFDGGDHLHPNDKGMQAMADSVDLGALRCPQTRRHSAGGAH